jgi:hypothetical protein
LAGGAVEEHRQPHGSLQFERRQTVADENAADEFIAPLVAGDGLLIFCTR